VYECGGDLLKGIHILDLEKLALVACAKILSATTLASNVFKLYNYRKSSSSLEKSNQLRFII